MRGRPHDGRQRRDPDAMASRGGLFYFVDYFIYFVSYCFEVFGTWHAIKKRGFIYLTGAVRLLSLRIFEKYFLLFAIFL
jgi:hypothetical protein